MTDGGYTDHRRPIVTGLDRQTARALTEAGYMPLADYIEAFGHDETTLVPELADDPHDAFFVSDEMMPGEEPAKPRLAQKIRLA